MESDIKTSLLAESQETPEQPETFSEECRRLAKLSRNKFGQILTFITALISGGSAVHAAIVQPDDHDLRKKDADVYKMSAGELDQYKPPLRELLVAKETGLFGPPLPSRFLRLDQTKNLGLVIEVEKEDLHSMPRIGLRGKTTIFANFHNTSEEPIQSLSATVAGREFGTVTSVLETPIKPGQKVRLEMTSDKKGLIEHSLDNPPLTLSVSFARAGQELKGSWPVGYSYYHGLSVPEDDFARILDFVHFPSASVDRLAELAGGLLDPQKTSDPVHIARAVYSVLEGEGILYRFDPYVSRPAPGEPLIEHSVQLPAETLYYGGDCEDLAILYNAVMAKLGVEVGFAVIPRHAFSLVPVSDSESVPLELRPFLATDPSTGRLFLPVDVSPLGVVKVTFDEAVRNNSAAKGKTESIQFLIPGMSRSPSQAESSLPAAVSQLADFVVINRRSPSYSKQEKR